MSEPWEQFKQDRLPMLQIAADRVFRHSTEPIPVMPAVPGIYRPMPVLDMSPEAITKRKHARWEANRYANAHPCYTRKGMVARLDGKQSKGLATGCIPIGATVAMGFAVGTVLAYLPPMADPKDAMPPNTPVTLQGGHCKHFPVIFARYCVAVVKMGRTHYHFPKAASIERQWHPVTEAA
jgi:hypothetical protein